MSLSEMQKEQEVWSKKNFKNRRPYQPILGAAEEVGELAHAYLKMEQGIRGNKEEHLANMKDAVADCVIFLMDLCNQMDWDMETIVNETWGEVKKRDWKKNALEGSVEEKEIPSKISQEVD